MSLLSSLYIKIMYVKKGHYEWTYIKNVFHPLERHALYSGCGLGFHIKDHVASFFMVKMVAWSSKMLVSSYIITWCQDPEDHDLNLLRGYLKSCILPTGIWGVQNLGWCFVHILFDAAVAYIVCHSMISHGWYNFPWKYYFNLFYIWYLHNLLCMWSIPKNNLDLHVG